MNQEAITFGQRKRGGQYQLNNLNQQITALEAERSQILEAEERDRYEAGLQRQGLVYYQFMSQTDLRLRERQTDLLVDLETDFRLIAHGSVGQEEPRLAAIELAITNEQSRRQEEREPLLAAAKQRLIELSQPQNNDPQRQIEREIIATALYRYQAQAQTDRARFHRTRIELGRLRLLTQTDFDNSQAVAGLEGQLVQIGQDEHRAAIAQKQADGLSDHYLYYKQATDGPEANGAQPAASPTILEPSRDRSEPNVISLAPGYRYLEVEESLHWSGRLAQAWDGSIDPEAFVRDYLDRISGDLQKDARIAEKEGLAKLEQIHQTASGPGPGLARPLGERVLQLSSN